MYNLFTAIHRKHNVVEGWNEEREEAAKCQNICVNQTYQL